MNLHQTLTLSFEQKQELLLSYRRLFKAQVRNIVERMLEQGFTAKVGHKTGTMVVLGKDNVHLLHPKLR